MKLKKMVSLLLVGGMAVSLLAGCGGDNESSVAGISSDEGSSYEEEKDIVEIEIYAMTLYGSDGLDEVEDAINEISESEIGVRVNLTYLDSSAYAEQVSLNFTSQEQMDLMMCTPIQTAGFSALTAQNQLQELDDLLTEYAPELYELMEYYLDGTSLNGSIYAVPSYYDVTGSAYVIMRADILDDLGLREKAENCNSWTEYQEILQAVVDSDYDGGKVTTALANNSSDGAVINLSGTMLGNDDWSECFDFDVLGDSYNIVAVDEDTDTVYSYFESEEFYKMISLMTELYSKGYVYKDAATAEDYGDTLIKNNVAFSVLSAAGDTVETDRYLSTGYEVVATEITDKALTTGSVTKFSWAIPVTAKEPEAAAEFLNLMYTNEDICNLLRWGIEGRDYEVNEEGEAVTLDTMEYQSSYFLWGNSFLAYPGEGYGGDYNEVAEAGMQEARLSKYFGCGIDTSDITNELTAVYNVILQYKAGYESGSVAAPETYEEYYNGEFCEALRAAGVQTVVDEYQSQLDEWLAGQ